MLLLYSFNKDKKNFSFLSKSEDALTPYVWIKKVERQGFIKALASVFGTEAKNINYHYTIYNVDKPSRKAFKHQTCIAFDLDLVDKAKLLNEIGGSSFSKGIHTSDDLLSSISEALKGLSIDEDMVSLIETGFGFHVYLHLKENYFSKDDIKLYKNPVTELIINLENAINSTAAAATASNLKFICDRQSFTNNKLMRLPGSQYIENVEGVSIRKECKILQSASRSYDLASLTKKKEIDESPVSELSKAWDDPVPHHSFNNKEILKVYTPNVTAVEEGCNFLKYCKLYPEYVQEPEWYAMLGIVGRLGTEDEGRKKAHEYSIGHSKYSDKECDSKLEQALTSAGPRTCEGIANIWTQSQEEGGCKTCPYVGKIKTPLLIQPDNVLATEATGFWILEPKEGGGMTNKGPSYEDLLKHYNNSHRFIVSEESNELYLFEEDNFTWQKQNRDHPKWFMEDCMSPKPKENHRKEFLSKILCNNIKSIEKYKDSNARYLNLNNGVFDMEENKLIAYSDNHFFFNRLDFNFEVEARSTLFEEFLLQIASGCSDKANLLKEYMAYCIMVPDCRFEKGLLLHGESGLNGKSTYLKIISSLIDKDSFQNVDVKNFTNPNSIIKLQHSLVNLSEEVSEFDLRGREAILKKFISGQYLEGKLLYHNTTEFENRCKLVMTCNLLPELRERSGGLRRRLLVVNFKERFKEDREFLKSLLREKSGIFNSLIEAKDALIKRDGFEIIPEIEREIEETMHLDDPIKNWIESRLEEDWTINGSGLAKYRITSKQMWSSFKEYMEDANIQKADQVTEGKFFRKIKNKEMYLGKNHRDTTYNNKRFQGYVGLKIIEDEEAMF